MSPVSRGRKKKTTKKKRQAPLRMPRYQDVPLPADPAPVPRAKWFTQGIQNVLGEADALLTASTPREVEQATARLLGAELYQAATGDHNMLQFSEWFTELASAAQADDREASARLLSGMDMLAPSHLRWHPHEALRTVDKHLPDWLRDLPDVVATGDTWTVEDAYGSRSAIIASYLYPGEDLPVAFLFDIEAGSIPAMLIEPGLFDDVDQAAAAWRSTVGDTAATAELLLTDDVDTLQPLTGVRAAGDDVLGYETRAAMDNWFRAPRRISDLEEAMQRRGDFLPASLDLFDVDATPLVGEFVGWYRDRRGAEPDRQAVEALAQDWIEGVVPQVRHSISPTRISAQLAMFADDWVPDDPLTATAKALFPDWVRWNGEQFDLAEDLIKRAVAPIAFDRRMV